ncbi:MAG: 3-isopropylmalate dehydratase [Burkholderiales bacterium]|nr:3-isopropylmalate dehydratase [Burkholderiales bacterium]
MTQQQFPGRIFFLSDDPEKIGVQLAGRDLELDVAMPLRDNVSTDEMTPQTVCLLFDERIGAGLLLAYRTGDRLPIVRNAIKAGGFSVIVAGKRYGKGSSREHSPLAHVAAGIRLIVAESFERIFRQNCDNLGLFTSSDFGLIGRIRAGEAISVEELVGGREALAADLLRSGGLLAYGKRRGMSASAVPRQAAPPAAEAGGPQTLVEKILARHALDPARPLASGEGGFVRADWRFSIDYYTGMIAHILHSNFARPVNMHDRDRILLFEDHLTYAHRSPIHIQQGLLPGVKDLSRAHQEFAEEYGLRNHGYLPGGEGSEGICHAMMAEQYALPGLVVVGTDSHTTHSGALGCLAFGVGSTDMAFSMVYGAIRLTVPQTLRIELNGRLPAGVTAKDLVLHLLALPDIKAGGGVGKVFEFAGPAIAHLSTDERATLTNMTAELGGFAGIVAPDAETLRFLRERRGIEFRLEPWMRSDEDARYSAAIAVDCAALSPMVARPGDPGNGLTLAGLAPRAKVDIAYGGSCTAGKREDFDQYHAVLAWAADQGLRAAPGVKLYLQFGTMAVRDYCVARGYLEAFERVGAEMLLPSCGACAGGGPGSSTRADEVTVSAINRNFPGRSGPGEVWLASPPTVAASAIAGELVSFGELRARHRA